MHSVRPYIRYRRAWGKVRRTASTVATGIDAPALVRNRRSGSSRSASPFSDVRTWKIVGTPGRPVIRCALERLHDPTRKGDPGLERERRAHPHAGQKLGEAVPERKLHHAQHPVGRGHLQVVHDRARDEGQVLVGERHPLGAAGGARRVHHRGEVGMQRPRRLRGSARRQALGVGDDRNPAGALGGRTSELGALGVADDHRRLDVGEDVVQVVALDRGVERRQGGARAPGALNRDRGGARRWGAATATRSPRATPSSPRPAANPPASRSNSA